MVEAMKQNVAEQLRGIDRYNPTNVELLEHYVIVQSQENAYDLESNLALLNMYQFSNQYKHDITCHILLKALTNLPHTDFVLCKCLLNKELCNESPIKDILDLADLLECCNFPKFWKDVEKMQDFCQAITGFHDSIRKFVCHVVGITFQTIDKSLLNQLLGRVDDHVLEQWVHKYGWKEIEGNMIFIANQDENIKTKNITEKIDFESVASIMATCI